MHAIVDPSGDIGRDRIPNNDNLLRCQLRKSVFSQYAETMIKELSARLLRADLRRNKAVRKIVSHFPDPKAVHLLFIGAIARYA